MRLHILHLEDNPADAELIRRILEADGIECSISCVKSRSEYLAALEYSNIDLILSDHKIPGFDGLSALAMAREKVPSCPFIFVSGAMGEDAAIESLRNGAADYLIKDRLGRLATAVRRAIRDAKDQQAKKEIELQFLRAQRMETIGDLASGIAHDLNNALVPIVIGSQLLSEDLHDEAERRNFLELIRASAQRCTQMVRQIVTFARGSKGQATSLHMDALLAEVAKIASGTLPKSIKVRTEAESGLWAVKGDATELHQVLINLCVNARDAMAAGGTLTLSARNAVLAPNDLRPEEKFAPGQYVALSVADTGTGIPARILPHIFEPFFTTKSPDKGTGLGLSTVSIIVRRHNGIVRVESEVGKGTVFMIFLPAVVAPAAVPSPAIAVPQSGHGELILIVDDEHLVIELARTTLENYGYRVLTAPNGLAAVACFEEHRDEIQLLLTDTDMPLLNGIDSIRAIQKIRSDIPIIVASGGKRETEILTKADIRHITTLGKPYQVDELLHAIASVLRRTEAASQGSQSLASS
jgi:signal transduction histidine kinase